MAKLKKTNEKEKDQAEKDMMAEAMGCMEQMIRIFGMKMSDIVQLQEEVIEFCQSKGLQIGEAALHCRFTSASLLASIVEQSKNHKHEETDSNEKVH